MRSTLFTFTSSLALALVASATNPSFDYVIVGGGNAGLVVANRLTENPNISVLVLEAGHNDTIDFNVTVPGLDLTVTGGSIVDWNYTTAPQTNLLNRTIAYPRGFVLGGSSSTNFMAYTRGAATTYDAWAKLGNPGWDWNTLFNYFKKSTHFTPPNANQSEVVFDINAYSHPSGGPLQISYGGYVEPISILFSEALANTSGANLQEGEINDGFPIGQAYLPLTIDPAHDTRSSSSTSFLAAAINRKNLKVITSALVRRLLFAPGSGTPTVTGVEYSDSTGALHQVTASREVISSAGTFGSPQLLMVSGIGPKAQLAAQNIPLRVQLEGVGQNMTDHLFFGGVYQVTDNITTFNQFNQNKTRFAEYLQQYANNMGELSGAISSMSAYERVPSDVLAAIPGGDQLEALNATWPHVQLEIIAFGTPPTPPPTPGLNYVSPAAVLLYPFSRGFVSLASNSTTDKVIVQPNWLQSPIDRAVAIWAFKQVREVMLSPAMSSAVIAEAFPGIQATSDDDILHAIQTVAHPIYQASSTCSMKPLKDNGVVDSNLRVYGVKNLRVIDASISPIIPSANTMAPTYMIAEKGADLVKATW